MFQIVMCNMDDEITSIFDYTLQDGNPNVNDVRTNLNSILLNKVAIQYDRIRNKFIYKRTLPITTDNFKMYLRIINSEDFLGFYKSDRDKLILLPYFSNTYSNSIVNISGDEAIIIKISGDCILSGNTVDNFGITTYQPSNIIFMKPIDVASNGLLKYSNEDGGDSFQYRIANIEQITYFELTIHNQDDEFIPNFSDYILLLQFVRHTTEENKLNSLLETLIDYVKQIYLRISQIVFPPSSISLCGVFLQWLGNFRLDKRGPLEDSDVKTRISDGPRFLNRTRCHLKNGHPTPSSRFRHERPTRIPSRRLRSGPHPVQPKGTEGITVCGLDISRPRLTAASSYASHPCYTGCHVKPHFWQPSTDAGPQARAPLQAITGRHGVT